MRNFELEFCWRFSERRPVGTRTIGKTETEKGPLQNEMILLGEDAMKVGFSDHVVWAELEDHVRAWFSMFAPQTMRLLQEAFTGLAPKPVPAAGASVAGIILPATEKPPAEAAGQQTPPEIQNHEEAK